MSPEDTQRLRTLMAYEAARNKPSADFPILPPVPSARYTDPNFYDLEREVLFRKTWLLAAHLDEIPKPSCFQRWGVAGPPVVLVNAATDRQMNVVLADIKETALEAAVDRLEAQQAQVLGVVTDTRQKAAVENLLQESTDKFGEVHLLFNNAGVVNGGEPTPVWALPDSDWDWVMGVNFYGVLNGIQIFAPHMIAHGEDGRIVNTASISAFIPGNVPYGISKSGVIILSEKLAFDLEAARSQIGASVICPGWVNTKIAEAERNRPGELKSSANPTGKGLDLQDLLSCGKSPDELATHVFDAIEKNNFYIFPHTGWDYLVREHTESMLARKGPHRFDLQAHVASREQGANI